MLILPAHTPAHLSAVRELFQEYAASLPFSLCFQGFEAELASLPGKYAPPAGRLFLALPAPDAPAAGCIALRPIDPGICGMKRLYTRPAYRAQGLGRQLCELLIAEARRIGYRAMRLDTSSDMTAAHRLYQSLGFTPIPRYNDDPLEDTIFMQLRL